MTDIKSVTLLYSVAGRMDESGGSDHINVTESGGNA